jgi:hypothetical protein
MICSALIWPVLLVSCISAKKLVLRQTATCEIHNRIDSLTSALQSEDSVEIDDYFTSAAAKERIPLTIPKKYDVADRGARIDRISIEKVGFSDDEKSARVHVLIVGITCNICRAIQFSYARAEMSLQRGADGRWRIHQSTDTHFAGSGSVHPQNSGVIKPHFKPIDPPCAQKHRG